MKNRLIKGVMMSSIVFLFIFFSLPFVSHDKEKKVTLVRIKVRFFTIINDALKILASPFVQMPIYTNRVEEGAIRCQQVKDYI